MQDFNQINKSVQINFLKGLKKNLMKQQSQTKELGSLGQNGIIYKHYNQTRRYVYLTAIRATSTLNHKQYLTPTWNSNYSNLPIHKIQSEWSVYAHVLMSEQMPRLGPNIVMLHSVVWNQIVDVDKPRTLNNLLHLTICRIAIHYHKYYIAKYIDNECCKKIINLI